MTNFRSRIDYTCDACNDRLFGDGRIICLDCESTKSLAHTVDFCGKQSCLEATKFPRRSDLTEPHTTMHDIVKTRKTVLARQFPKLKKEAKEAIKRAYSKLLVRNDREGREKAMIDNDNTIEGLRAEANGTITTSEVPAPVFNCAVCHESVKRPCWYCVDCLSESLYFSFHLDLTLEH